MKTENHLAEIKKYLSALPPQEVEDILQDQREYIQTAISRGRLEADVIASLGEPRKWAAELLAVSKLSTNPRVPQKMSEQAYDIFSVLKAFLILAPLNFFVLLGPFLVSLCVLFSLWSVSFALAVLFLFGVFWYLITGLFFFTSIYGHLSCIFFYLGVLGLGFLSVMGLFFITKKYFLIIFRYLRWNLEFIKQERKTT